MKCQQYVGRGRGIIAAEPPPGGLGTNGLGVFTSLKRPPISFSQVSPLTNFSLTLGLSNMSYFVSLLALDDQAASYT